MSLNRRDAKRDANEADIIDALRRAGCSVTQLSGEGVPDLLVGRLGYTYLMEVKDKRGTLTDAQKHWHSAWMGATVPIVRTVDDALRVVEAID